TLTLDPELRTAQSLTPGLARALAESGWQPSQINLVAVTVGPGSFTGLRIGVTTAKVFAYAVQCECQGVDTLEVIAAQAPVQQTPALWAVLDAQRQQLFAARYQAASGAWHACGAAAIIDNETFLAGLEPGSIVTGAGLKRLSQLPEGVAAVESSHWQPRAETVGSIAYRDYMAGKRASYWELAPRYLRASAAEEKIASTGKNV
ncbi:MAG TPA: tRNA (adenosine(37)-N6)-threonylcarbamoyltransferase complex dimerization subunit type 1 TsaB, partial [Pirellulaceae bacterium]|nr:tRNA (adenosine(37)-N6)-threonylcarbamoyltransferase complex dimerization subunit type 1 TsaB [Pirellulaceae bacterium]